VTRRVDVSKRIIVSIRVLVQGLGVGDVGVGEGAGRQRVVRAVGVHRPAGELIRREEAGATELPTVTLLGPEATLGNPPHLGASVCSGDALKSVEDFLS